MATLQLPYVCGGMCGVDGCPQEFHSEKELTMHCINEDETQVHTKRPFCDQCFMIFDETDNPVVHECEVGKAQAQISMALSQCETTIIDLTIGGNVGDELCSFRNEDWYLSKAPLYSDFSKLDSSSSEEGILDNTVIPAIAANKKRKSLEDSTSENRRKSPRIEAQQMEAKLSPKPTKPNDFPLCESTAAKPEDPDNVVISGSHQSRKAILSPIKFVPEAIHTSSVIKEKTHIPIPIPETKQKIRNTKKQKSDKPVNPAIIPTTATSVGASTAQPNQKAIQKSVLSTRLHLPSVPVKEIQSNTGQKAIQKSVSSTHPPSVPVKEIQSNTGQKAIQKSVSSTPLHPPSVPVKEIQSNTGQKGGTNPKKPEVLESIGIFWDIENIAIPINVSVSLLVRKLRNTFVTVDKREVEFMCVCDVHKEKKHVIDDLNSCNVTIVHVNCYSKNAADERLKHYLNRFAQTYPSPSTVVLLSGDVNFGPVVSNLTRFYSLNTILMHNLQCSKYLKDTAYKTILFEEFIQGIGPQQTAAHHQPSFILIDNLPQLSVTEIYNRLESLCDNTGGKIVNMKVNQGLAVIRFRTLELCIRAQKRLNGFAFRPWLMPIRARFSPETIDTFR